MGCSGRSQAVRVPIRTVGRHRTGDRELADDDHHPGEEDEDVASPGEVRHAIETLGVGDIKKLERVAHFWWAHYRLQGRSGSHEDLLQEAVEHCLRDVGRRRRWPKKRIGIVRFLNGVIRSIASHQAESAVKEQKRAEAAHAFDVPPAPVGNPTPAPPLRVPDAESRLAAREELDAIQGLFEDEPRTLEVLHCKAQGMTEGEIRENLRMDQREFDRHKKRILRAFVSYEKGHGDDHGNQ